MKIREDKRTVGKPDSWEDNVSRKQVALKNNKHLYTLTAVAPSIKYMSP